MYGRIHVFFFLLMRFTFSFRLHVRLTVMFMYVLL